MKSLRVEKGLNQTELADIMNVTRQSVSKIEKNPLNANVKTLMKYADALGCKVSDFFVGM